MAEEGQGDGLLAVKRIGFQQAEERVQWKAFEPVMLG